MWPSRRCTFLKGKCHMYKRIVYRIFTEHSHYPMWLNYCQKNHSTHPPCVCPVQIHPVKQFKIITYLHGLQGGWVGPHISLAIILRNEFQTLVGESNLTIILFRTSITWEFIFLENLLVFQYIFSNYSHHFLSIMV